MHSFYNEFNEICELLMNLIELELELELELASACHNKTIRVLRLVRCKK